MLKNLIKIFFISCIFLTSFTGAYSIKGSIAFDAKTSELFFVGEKDFLQSVLMEGGALAIFEKNGVMISERIKPVFNEQYVIIDKYGNQFRFFLSILQNSDEQRLFSYRLLPGKEISPEVFVNKNKVFAKDGAYSGEISVLERNGFVKKFNNVQLDISYTYIPVKKDKQDINFLPKIFWFTVTTYKGAKIVTNKFFSLSGDLFNRVKSFFVVEDKNKNDSNQNSEVVIENESKKYFFSSLINKFLYWKNVARPQKIKQNQISVNYSLPTRVYKVGDESSKIIFRFINGLGEFVQGEKVSLKLKSKKKHNNHALLSSSTIMTNAEGIITTNILFGNQVSDYLLTLKIRNKKFKIELLTEAEKPEIINNLTKKKVMIEPVGKLLKNYIRLKVTDKFGNAIKGREVILYELTNEDEPEPIKLFELKTDSKGMIKSDYRVSDMAGRYILRAKVKDTELNTVYNIEAVSTEPENLVLEANDYFESVVGFPLKDEFKVRAFDYKGSPVANLKVEFVLMDYGYEEIARVVARTDKSGIAQARFNNPEIAGEYQIVAFSDKIPDIEVPFILKVLPGESALIEIVTGNNQKVIWENEALLPLTVRVLDDRKNPIDEVRVVWRAPSEIEFRDKDEMTEPDGTARAQIFVKETKKEYSNVIVEVGKRKQSFVIYPQEPSIYKLYLETSAEINVFSGQSLPEPIKMVLRDQYGNVLTSQDVYFEYSVFSKGIKYRQNIKKLTDEKGVATIDFKVSDQTDEINLQGKFYVDNKPVITWVKINVIPENITNLIITPSSYQGIVDKQLDQQVKIFIGDKLNQPVTNIGLKIKLLESPDPLYRPEEISVKTDITGHAFFNPLLGKVSGQYIYSVRLKDLYATFNIEAVAAEPQRIQIFKNDGALFSAGKSSGAIQVCAYDAYSNTVNRGMLIYNINRSPKVLKHDFNERIILNSSGITDFKFAVPSEAGRYYLFVTDEKYGVKDIIEFFSVESDIEDIELVSDGREEQFIVGKTYNNVFKVRPKDKFGNLLSKHKVKLELIDQNGKIVIQSEAVSNRKGEASFKVAMPESSGKYFAVVFSEIAPLVRKEFSLEVIPGEVVSARVYSGDNQLVSVGSFLAEDIEVMLLDKYDNPVANQEVRWNYYFFIGEEKRSGYKNSKTGSEGIASFNITFGSPSGVREIRAYYLVGRSWNYVPFYVKVLSNEAQEIKFISGETTILKTELAQKPLVYRVVDSVGNYVPNVVLSWGLTKQKGEAFPQQEIQADAEGYFRIILQDIEPGVYELSIQIKGKSDIHLISSIKVEDDTPIIKEQMPAIEDLKISLNNQAVQVYVLKSLVDKRLEFFTDEGIFSKKVLQVLGRDGIPVQDLVLTVEIFDSAINKTFMKIIKTDSLGEVRFPAIKSTYPRQLGIRIIEPKSKVSEVYNVKIQKRPIIENKISEKQPVTNEKYVSMNIPDSSYSIKAMSTFGKVKMEDYNQDKPVIFEVKKSGEVVRNLAFAVKLVQKPEGSVFSPSPLIESDQNGLLILSFSPDYLGGYLFRLESLDIPDFFIDFIIELY